ncbi:hypothetical protein [Limnohabitans sp. Bal53]|uniref:hypothetical protein n=1 Tax=Limnohabitans sp. Bal53 TaxID=1977910 RepID=UPI000D3C7F62|nr:hypothetical protein [Limnohabitans sp. Bal53]PUE41424.1 hypothetical protein B9Z50_06870 [Limnohabitans sp. Bal53]
MTDLDLFAETHAVIQELRNKHLADSPQYQRYDLLCRQLWLRVGVLQRQDFRPVVFDANCPGFVKIGYWPEDKVYTVPAKLQDSMRDAWQILCTRGRLTFASANAVRNRMNNVADWIQDKTGIWELAGCLRSPYLVISDGEGISTNHRLQIVFDA